MPDALVSPDNFARAETDLYFGNIVERRRLRQVLHPSRADPDRSSTRHPGQPRHSLFGRRVRPRCRTGHGDTARRRRPVHVDAGDRRGPLHARRSSTTRANTPSPAIRSAPATSPSPCASSSTPTTRTMSRLCTDLQDGIVVDQDKPGSFDVPRLGSGEPEDCSRRAGDAGDHAARHQATPSAPRRTQTRCGT